MLERLRDQIGTAGLIVAVVALVAALGGGAYAATGGGTDQGKAKASASKKGPRGPRGPKGPAGPAGAPGPAGPAGAKGDNGAAGANGTNGSAGANGQSVAVSTVPLAGEEGKCVGTGGSKFTVGATNAYACNGEEGAQGNNGNNGSPWVVGTAPTGALLKGTWSIQQYEAAAEGEIIPVPIATGVPIAGQIATSYVVPAGAPADPNRPLGCTGTADAPTAELAPNQGLTVLCVYVKEATNLNSGFTPVGLNSSGGGGVLQTKSAGAGAVSAYGTWALQAP
jgi:hypothetical protein